MNAYSTEIAWSWPFEVHYDSKTNQPTAAYWRWRAAGMACKHAVRYPVGFKHRLKCRGFVLDDSSNTILGYIESRKQVYFPMYQKAVQKHPKFIDLQERLRNGENLCIVEVDGPHSESLGHYMKEYGVPASFFKDNTVVIDKTTLEILLNDPLHPFGHGFLYLVVLIFINFFIINLLICRYCLAACLLNIDLMNSFSSSSSSSSASATTQTINGKRQRETIEVVGEQEDKEDGPSLKRSK